MVRNILKYEVWDIIYELSGGVANMSNDFCNNDMVLLCIRRWAMGRYTRYFKRFIGFFYVPALLHYQQ